MRTQLEELLGRLPTENRPEFHHTYQQAVETWAKSRGIDIHDGKYLRLVDANLHDAIDREQRRFWGQMKNSFGTTTIADTIEAAKRAGKEQWLWDRMSDFNAAVEKNFGDLWLKPGFTDDHVRELKKTLCISETTPFDNVYGSKGRAKIGEQLGIRGRQFWKDIIDGFDDLDGGTRTGWRTLRIPGMDLEKLLQRVEKVFTIISLTVIMTELQQMCGSNDPDLPLLISDYRNALRSLEGTAGHVDPTTIGRINERLDSALDRLQVSEYHRYLMSLALSLEEVSN